jgi:hypothetical protein
MAFKEYDKSLTLLDMEIQRAVTHSRNQQVLSEIDAVINWEPIEKTMSFYYEVQKIYHGSFKHNLKQGRIGLMLTVWEMTNTLHCKWGRNFTVYIK